MVAVVMAGGSGGRGGGSSGVVVVVVVVTIVAVVVVGIVVVVPLVAVMVAVAVAVFFARALLLGCLGVASDSGYVFFQVLALPSSLIWPLLLYREYDGQMKSVRCSIHHRLAVKYRFIYLIGHLCNSMRI